MKVQLVRTYSIEFKDEAELRDAIREMVTDGIGAYLSKEDWEKARDAGSFEDDATWNEEEERKSFYDQWPLEKVGVEYPPTTLHDYMLMCKYDITDTAELDIDDIGLDDGTNDEWRIEE